MAQQIKTSSWPFSTVASAIGYNSLLNSFVFVGKDDVGVLRWSSLSLTNLQDPLHSWTEPLPVPGVSSDAVLGSVPALTPIDIGSGQTEQLLSGIVGGPDGDGVLVWLVGGSADAMLIAGPGGKKLGYTTVAVSQPVPGAVGQILQIVATTLDNHIYYTHFQWPWNKQNTWTDWGSPYSYTVLPAVGYSLTTTWILAPTEGQNSPTVNYRMTKNDSINYTGWASLGSFPVTPCGNPVTISQLYDYIWEADSLPEQCAVFQPATDGTVYYQYETAEDGEFNGTWLPMPAYTIDPNNQIASVQVEQWGLIIGIASGEYSGQLFCIAYAPQYEENGFVMPNNYALGNIAIPNGCVVPCQNGTTNYALIVFANNLGDPGTTVIAEIPLYIEGAAANVELA